MKKLFTLLAILLLSACSSGKQSAATKDRTVTLPFSLYGHLEAEAKENIIQELKKEYLHEKGIENFQITEDGVTFVVKGSELAKVQKDIKENVDQGIKSLISEGTLGITKAVYNDAMNEFEVTVEGEEVPFTAQFSLFFFHISGNIYQLFDGVKAEDVHTIVKFVNAEGKVLETSDSKDFGNLQ